MFANSLRRTARITLPPADSSAGQTDGGSAAGGDGLTVIAVTPETVQAAIATLDRPEQYSRVIRVEQFWGGGSGSFEYLGDCQRPLDPDGPDPGGRPDPPHHHRRGDHLYLVRRRARCSAAPPGDITADDEQTIPTYEDILALPAESFTAADYRTASGVNCIYAETAEDAYGYVQRYWVSVDTGLLVASERLLDGETIYRMASLTADLSTPSADRFILPDGTVLLDG